MASLFYHNTQAGPCGFTKRRLLSCSFVIQQLHARMRPLAKANLRSDYESVTINTRFISTLKGMLF